MPVNMKDIARDLGVSVVTVSKALREHPDISKSTRERILLKVRELGYRPNLTARSLVTGRSSLIGLIVPDLIHPFFADVAKGLSLALRRQGYFLIISSSEEDAELEREEIEHMLAHRLDALIVATCQPDPESLRKIQQGETPLILLDRSFKDLRSHFVGSDDYAAGKLATEHLLAIGCERLAHIRGPENSVGHRRLKGFLDTLKKARPQGAPGIHHSGAPRRCGRPPEWGLCLEESARASSPSGRDILLQRYRRDGCDRRGSEPGNRRSEGIGSHRMRQSPLRQRDSRAAFQYRPEKRRDWSSSGEARSRHPLGQVRCAGAGLPRNHPAASPCRTRFHCPEQPCQIETGSSAS